MPDPTAAPGAHAVLDASALLAYLHGEPGAETVAIALRRGARISTANWAEVLSKVAEIGRDPTAFASELRSIGLLGKTLLLEPLTDTDSIAIAELRPRTRRLGLSLGDRACLALGRRFGARVLTADRAWARLTGPHRLEFIRPSPPPRPGPGRPRDR